VCEFRPASRLTLALGFGFFVLAVLSHDQHAVPPSPSFGDSVPPAHNTRMHILNLSSTEIWCEILSHAVHSCIEFSAQDKSLRIIECFTHQDKTVICKHTQKRQTSSHAKLTSPNNTSSRYRQDTVISLHRLNITDDDMHNKLYLKVIILGCDMYLLQGTF